MKIRTVLFTLGNIAGVALVMFGMAICVIGIAMTLDVSDPRSRQGPSIALASMVFILPGLLMTWLARRARKRMELLQAVAGMVASYRRISVADLAAKLSVPAPRAAALLAMAMARGLVRGRFDRSTDEFFTDEGEAGLSAARHCPACGAPLERIVLRGEAARCRSCGGVIA